MKRVLAISTGSVTWARPKMGRKTSCSSAPTGPRNTSGPAAAITHSPPQKSGAGGGKERGAGPLHIFQRRDCHWREQARQDQAEQSFARHARVERKDVADGAACDEQCARNQERHESPPADSSNRVRPRAGYSPAERGAAAAQTGDVVPPPCAAPPYSRAGPNNVPFPKPTPASPEFATS